MTLTSHAQVELAKTNYSGRTTKFVLDIITLLDRAGATDFELKETLTIVSQLSQGITLTPLTSNSDEWSYIEDSDLWQNTRSSTTYSRDGGQSWYDIVDDSKNNNDAYEQEFWGPVYLGVEDIKIGSIMRVKEDGYSVGIGLQHNGKRGKFTGARNGYVYIQYDGDTVDHTPAPHKPENVERLVTHA